MSETQNYQNHTRWFPLVHFVLFPLLLVNLIWHCVRTYQDFSWDRAEFILVSIILILLSFAARLQPLKAQDRVIRLEEQLRYANVLPKDLAEKAGKLRAGQMIALRFASDAELPDMVQRTLNGEFATSKEIRPYA
jgi:Family of unknown function (DUF6526)